MGTRKVKGFVPLGILSQDAWHPLVSIGIVLAIKGR